MGVPHSGEDCTVGGAKKADHEGHMWVFAIILELNLLHFTCHT